MGDRLETGVMQPEGDWPGIFIRGDNAFGYAMQLRTLLAHMEERSKSEKIPNSELMAWASVQELANLLLSCRVGGPELPNGTRGGAT
jgi:hypothetical protein